MVLRHYSAPQVPRSSIDFSIHETTSDVPFVSSSHTKTPKTMSEDERSPVARNVAFL